jgi:ankyrin repeat protein
MARALLAKGADPNIKNKVGGTALMIAAATGQAEIVEALLEKGADTTAKDNKGLTALQWATKGNHKETAEMIRQKVGSKQ